METDARNGLGGGNCTYTGSCREPKMEIPVEWLLVVLHVAAGPFERGERRVPFIEMTYLRAKT